jgi:hypothetical protein
MVVVMVKVMLPRRRFPGGSLARNSAPNAKASARRQRASAGGARLAALVHRIRRHSARGDRAARQAVNCLHGRGYGLGVRLGPAKTSGQALKKISDLGARHRLILILRLVFLWLGNIRILFAHANLIVICLELCARIRRATSKLTLPL